MTLKDFSFAIEGFNELEEEHLRWQFFNTRRMIWWLIKPHLGKGDDLREEDIISIPEFDKEIERVRRENLPLVEIKIDAD